MTKKLILLRHAKSYWGKSGRFLFKGNDHDRPLNKRGRKATKLMSQYFFDNFCLEYVKNKKNNQDFEKLKKKFPTCAVAVLLSNAKNWSSIDKEGFELKKFIIPKSISD